MRDEQPPSGVIGPPSGGPEREASQCCAIVYDATVVFLDRFADRPADNRDEMLQAARTATESLAPGTRPGASSERTEHKLATVARARLEELLLDCEDFLRRRSLPLWENHDPRAQAIGKLAGLDNRTAATYQAGLETDPETAANTLICLIHQTNHWLDQRLREPEKEFLAPGEFAAKAPRAHSSHRKPPEWRV